MDSNNRNELNNNRNNATIRKLKKVNRTIPQDKVQPTKPDTVHIQQNNPQQQCHQNAAVQPVQSHLKKLMLVSMKLSLPQKLSMFPNTLPKIKIKFQTTICMMLSMKNLTASMTKILC